MVRHVLAIALAALVLLSFSGRASADAARPMYVLTLDTDDADEQADALSAALRSRVRMILGNAALGDTPSSLSMLTQALRCPPNPDTSCLNKIADTLKTDKFIWGKMNRAGKGQVTVDLHLYVRKQPDVVTHETYSDNLKESNDETLRALAGKLYDRLTGTSSTGIVHVRAGEAAGQVFVDGERRAKLDHGLADVELTVGMHNVEVRVPGNDSVKQQINVVGGQETTFDATLAPAGTTDSTGPSTRRLVAYGALGLGVVSGVVSALFISKYAGDVSDANNDRHLYTGPADCNDHGGPASAACNDRSQGQRDSTLAWTFGGIGAAAIITGVVLIETEPKTTASDAPKNARRFQVLPDVGPRSSGLTVLGSF